jgi:hypothetical protein
MSEYRYRKMAQMALDTDAVGAQCWHSCFARRRGEEERTVPDTCYWVARGRNFAHVGEVRDLTQENGRKGRPGFFFKQAGRNDPLQLDDTDVFCMTGGRDGIQAELNETKLYRIVVLVAGMQPTLEMYACREKLPHIGGDRVTAIMIAPGPCRGVPKTMEEVRDPDVTLAARGPDDPPWGAAVDLGKVASAMDWIKP